MATQPCKILLLRAGAVRRLLSMKDCIDCVRSSFESLASNQAIQPLRSVLRMAPLKEHEHHEAPPDLFITMPAQLTSHQVFGLKLINIVHANAQAGIDTHQGLVVLCDQRTGLIKALIDAGPITAIRTAAASAVATNLLARHDAKTCGIIGSGIQAATHIEAMLCVRQLESVRIWARAHEKAQKLVDTFVPKYPQVQFVAVATAQEAVEHCDIVCTCTGAQTPVVKGEWLAPGSHINAVGSCTPFARELDTNAIQRSRLFSDRKESLYGEAGDFLIPLRAGEITDDHYLGDIPEVLSQKVPGRTSHTDITLFKSLGLAVEDLASGEFLYNEAVKRGVGSWIDWNDDDDDNDE